jgi:hypothetical protein
MGMTTTGSAFNVYSNGTTLTAGAGTAVTLTGLNVGGGLSTTGVGTQPWVGYIGEIIVYTNSVTTAQRQAIEGYLGFKWNLTAPLVTTLAGTGTATFADGTGTAAGFGGMFYITKDQFDNLYSVDNNRIRKIVPSTGVVTTIVGNGTASCVDGGPGVATTYGPIAITSDYSNYVYFIDNGPNSATNYGAIRRLTINSAVGTVGQVTTLWSTTSSAQLQYGQAMALNRAVLPTVNLYICDTYNHVIRLWSGQAANTTIPIVAGAQGVTGQADGTGGSARFLYPGGIEIDAAGQNAWIAGANGCRVMKMTIPGYVVTTVCGSTAAATNTRRDGPPSIALTSYPRGCAISLDGRRIYWTDTAGGVNGNNIRYYDTVTNYTYTIAGSTIGTVGSVNSVGLNSTFATPLGLVITSDGILYCTEQSGFRIRRINLNPFWSTPTHPYARMMPFSAPFNPMSISNCAVWFDGGDYSTLQFTGSSITQWNDKSGNGYNATVYSGRIGATWSTASNCVYFQASTVGYQTSYPANPSTETMFIVANVDSPANVNNNAIICGALGARSFGFGYSGSPASGTGFSSYLSSQSGWSSTSISGPTAGTTAVATGTVSSISSVACGLNGSNLTAGTISNFTSSAGTTLGVDTTNSSYYFKGYVMEIIFYSRVLSTEEQRLVQGYLTHKWNLQPSLISTHPFKTFIPSSPTPFSPVNIPSCALWLDAGGIATTNFIFSNASSNVGTWLDKSGSGRHLLAVSGTTSFSNNAVNLNSSYMTVTNAVNLASFSLFIVAKSNGAIFNQSVFTGRPSTSSSWGSTDGFGFYLDYQTTTRLYGQSDSQVASNTVTTRYANIFSFVSGSTTIGAWINGTAVSGASGLSTRTTTAAGFGLGVEWQGSAYGNNISTASIYEIIVYNASLTTQQRQQVEGYLMTKWPNYIGGSLPAAHAYKNSTVTLQ